MMHVKLIAQKPKSNFKTTTISPSLFDYSDARILVKRTITMTGARADVAA